MPHADASFRPLRVAVLTVSDTRTLETDTSGGFLAEALGDAGHIVAKRELVIDDRYLIRALVAAWIADAEVEVVLITGGTGFRDRDVTPEAVVPLLDREIPGFGELFRSVSAEEIGSSTVQSRAVAGLANRTFVACLPGSTGACRTAWTRLLAEQLDSRHRPCNFVELLGPPA
ncbi:MAG: molybdenum cofactor biosynthesis protein B [Pseudomonadota bacterium]